MYTSINQNLFRLAAVLVLLTAAAAGLSAQEGVQTVVPDVFFDDLEKAREDGGGVVLDIRTPAEYDMGHAPGSLNIDYYASDFVKKLEELDPSESYFIYCNSGNRSGRSLGIFKQLGFETVYDLAGGWSYNSRRLLAIEE